MSAFSFQIDKSWSLFLDRDGVINKLLPNDYVKGLHEFEFNPGVPEAIKILSGKFGHVFIVTNQQGIGKGLMTEKDLEIIHTYLLKEIAAAGGRIDRIYHAPGLHSPENLLRKPAIGMALKAKEDFPGVDFAKSIMVGDSEADMGFADAAGMKKVLISKNTTQHICPVYPSLSDFAKSLA